MTRNESGRARPPGAPSVRSAKSYRTNARVGYVPRTKSSSLRCVVCRAAKTSFAIRELLTAFLIQSNSEIKTHVWYARLVCLMPDHLHALISFPYERPIKQIMSDWKRFLTTKLNIEWQRDFFDHRLRKDESYREKADIFGPIPFAQVRSRPQKIGLICGKLIRKNRMRCVKAERCVEARPAVAPYQCS